jgi:hypothetical protein
VASMAATPTPVGEKQLKELGISVHKPKD